MPPPDSSAPSAAPQPAELVPRGPRAYVLWFFFVLCGFLFAWGSPQRDFWGADETLSASVARTMEETGSWLVPRLAGQPHLGVPPLSYWLAATLHALTG